MTLIWKAVIFTWKLIGYVASDDMSRSYCPAVSSTVMLLMVAAEINAGNVYIIPLRERNPEEKIWKDFK